MSGACRFELRLGAPGYPEMLAMSERPPKTLYGIGDADAVRTGLGVIGSRRMSPYGRACARLFAGWAAEQGVTVISGAAYGCDAAALDAALDMEGSAVAVLGCGADVDYPASSRALLARIRDRGAVVSEQPWGTRPMPWMFPERNRIIAALSSALLVVEARLPSGTFSTADHAAAIGRPVLVVPGSVFYEGCSGTNRLLRQGAIPVTDVADLADELRAADLIDDYGDALPDARLTIGSLSAAEAALASALAADPMRPDEAARVLGTDLVSVTRMLPVLEAGGAVRRYPDGRYGPFKAGDRYNG